MIARKRGHLWRFLPGCLEVAGRVCCCAKRPRVTADGGTTDRLEVERSGRTDRLGLGFVETPTRPMDSAMPSMSADAVARRIAH